MIDWEFWLPGEEGEDEGWRWRWSFTVRGKGVLWRWWCFLGANELRQLVLIEMVVGVMVLVGGDWAGLGSSWEWFLGYAPLGRVYLTVSSTLRQQSQTWHAPLSKNKTTSSTQNTDLHAPAGHALCLTHVGHDFRREEVSLEKCAWQCLAQASCDV